MLRLILFTLASLSLAVSTAGIARADVTIHVEDFEDEQGDPAFDPMFVHTFSREDGEPNWDLIDALLTPEHGAVLALWPAQDTVSFLLNPCQEVVYASIDVQSWGGVPPIDAYSVDFIGRDGSRRIFQTQPGEWETIEISSQEIGPIISIVMRSGEGYFDNITIHVIPEPAGVLTAFIGFVVCLASIVIKGKHKKAIRIH